MEQRTGVMSADGQSYLKEEISPALIVVEAL